MNLSDLKNFDINNIQLDVNEIGSWPMPAKMALIAILVVGLIFAGYWFDTKDQLLDLDKKRAQEIELKTTFEVRQRKAANLDAYKQQLAEMERSFGTMLRQLPNKTEVAELLVDVSQTGIASGLEFQLFQPSSEIKKEFYAELPIKIRVIGNYREFGGFVSSLAALPRIVTLHNVNLTRDNDNLLTMDATAKTYRYLEESK